MTAAHDIDWPQLLAERLTTTHPDVLRELLATFIHTLMGAEADAVCGAAYGQRSAERTNHATPIGIVNSTPGPDLWIWRSLSCGKARTFQSGIGTIRHQATVWRCLEPKSRG